MSKLRYILYHGLSKWITSVWYDGLEFASKCLICWTKICRKSGKDKMMYLEFGQRYAFGKDLTDPYFVKSRIVTCLWNDLCLWISNPKYPNQWIECLWISYLIDLNQLISTFRVPKLEDKDGLLNGEKLHCEMLMKWHMIDYMMNFWFVKSCLVNCLWIDSWNLISNSEPMHI